MCQMCMYRYCPKVVPHITSDLIEHVKVGEKPLMICKAKTTSCMLLYVRRSLDVNHVALLCS